MSDLEGDDAFDRVLDKLLEATAKRSHDEGALVEARTQATNARAAQKIVEDQIAVLRCDIVKYTSAEADQTFTELYDAIEEAIRVLGAGSVAATALRAAVTKAKHIVDPIPF